MTGTSDYVMPGAAYRGKETIPEKYATVMKPDTTGGDTVTSDHALVAGELWTAQITNRETKGQLTVTKTDKGSTALPGAEFKLVSADGGDYSMTRTTGNDGVVSFKNLPYGTYTLTEEKAPDGYTAVPNSQQPDGVGLPATIVIDDDHRIV